jgi:hypothetical protein
MPHNTNQSKYRAKQKCLRRLRGNVTSGAQITYHIICEYKLQRQCVCDHQGYDNTVSLRNKRNRRSCDSIVGYKTSPHNVRNRRNCGSMITTEERCLQGIQKYATWRWRSDSTGAIRLNESAT